MIKHNYLTIYLQRWFGILHLCIWSCPSLQTLHVHEIQSSIYFIDAFALQTITTSVIHINHDC
jgi:hypothetical protein